MEPIIPPGWLSYFNRYTVDHFSYEYHKWAFLCVYRHIQGSGFFVILPKFLLILYFCWLKLDCTKETHGIILLKFSMSHDDYVLDT